MRTSVVLRAAVPLLLLAGPAHASDKEARAIVQQAVKAQGGEEALKKAAFCLRTETGTRARPGKDIEFSMEATRRLPDRLRLKTDVEKKFQTVAVLNGEKGWIRAGGSASEMPPPLLAEVRDDAVVAYLATVVPVLYGDFKLSVIPGIQVDGEETQGVGVESRRYGEARLYFRKGTGTLARIDRRGPVEGALGNKTYLYSDYKNFGGARLPAKEVQSFNGKKIAEVTVTSVKFLTEVDEKTFAKP